jgi:hypothetical protein
MRPRANGFHDARFLKARAKGIGSYGAVNGESNTPARTTTVWRSEKNRQQAGLRQKKAAERLESWLEQGLNAGDKIRKGRLHGLFPQVCT